MADCWPNGLSFRSPAASLRPWLSFNLDISMEKLLIAIQDWPVLIQGALGSALFAFVLFAGQKLTANLSDRYVNHSKQSRETRLRNQIIRLSALLAKDNSERAFLSSVLWLRASRDVIKAFIWLALGLSSASFLPALGTVGYIGCIYYLFSALDVVKGISYDGNVGEQIAKLQAEIKAIGTDDV
jgi:hypothetical protein